MLCLPQAFDLFLRQLVGGLHTVYTKCKRLDIVPLVCNVEQVRVLRSVTYCTKFWQVVAISIYLYVASSSKWW